MSLLALALVLAQAAPLAPPAAEAPPKPVPAGPVVALDVAQGRTALGTITIALNQEKAPISVRNFLAYLRAGHYDGTIFHRVIPGFMVQGGGFTIELEEKATRPPIRNEAKNGLRNSRGTVAFTSRAFLMTTPTWGTFWWGPRLVVGTIAIRSTTSIPSITSPKTA